MSETCIHKWKKQVVPKKTIFLCELCGDFSKTTPTDYVEEPVEPVEEPVEEHIACRHVWICIRDRCHNRGSGKYKAYKCTLCDKFQRR